MIQANELRIGNLYDQFGNVTKVTWPVIRDLEVAPKSQLWCKQIPLTEEWLLKFGFERYGADENAFEIFDCVISLSENKIWVCVETEFANKEIELMRPEYFHQLQNLYFALTGKELEIK